MNNAPKQGDGLLSAAFCIAVLALLFSAIPVMVPGQSLEAILKGIYNPTGVASQSPTYSGTPTPTPQSPTTGTGVIGGGYPPTAEDLKKSERHIRFRFGMLHAGGKWTPERGTDGFPYVPSAGARLNPELERMERDAWAKVLERYDNRMLAFYGLPPRTQAATAGGGKAAQKSPRAPAPVTGGGGIVAQRPQHSGSRLTTTSKSGSVAGSGGTVQQIRSGSRPSVRMPVIPGGAGSGSQASSGARNPAAMPGVPVVVGGQGAVQKRPGGRKTTGANPGQAGRPWARAAPGLRMPVIPGGHSAGQRSGGVAAQRPQKPGPRQSTTFGSTQTAGPGGTMQQIRPGSQASAQMPVIPSGIAPQVSPGARNPAAIPGGAIIAGGQRALQTGPGGGKAIGTNPRLAGQNPSGGPRAGMIQTQPGGAKGGTQPSVPGGTQQQVVTGGSTGVQSTQSIPQSGTSTQPKSGAPVIPGGNTVAQQPGATLASGGPNPVGRALPPNTPGSRAVARMPVIPGGAGTGSQTGSVTRNPVTMPGAPGVIGGQGASQTGSGVRKATGANPGGLVVQSRIGGSGATSGPGMPVMPGSRLAGQNPSGGPQAGASRTQPGGTQLPAPGGIQQRVGTGVNAGVQSTQPGSGVPVIPRGNTVARRPGATLTPGGTNPLGKAPSPNTPGSRTRQATQSSSAANSGISGVQLGGQASAGGQPKPNRPSRTNAAVVGGSTVVQKSPQAPVLVPGGGGFATQRPQQSATPGSSRIVGPGSTAQLTRPGSRRVARMPVIPGGTRTGPQTGSVVRNPAKMSGASAVIGGQRASQTGPGSRKSTGANPGGLAVQSRIGGSGATSGPGMPVMPGSRFTGQNPLGGPHAGASRTQPGGTQPPAPGGIQQRVGTGVNAGVQSTQPGSGMPVIPGSNAVAQQSGVVLGPGSPNPGGKAPSPNTPGSRIRQATPASPVTTASARPRIPGAQPGMRVSGGVQPKPNNQSTATGVQPGATGFVKPGMPLSKGKAGVIAPGARIVGQLPKGAAISGQRQNHNLPRMSGMPAGAGSGNAAVQAKRGAVPNMVPSVPQGRNRTGVGSQPIQVVSGRQSAVPNPGARNMPGSGPLSYGKPVTPPPGNAPGAGLGNQSRPAVTGVPETLVRAMALIGFGPPKIGTSANLGQQTGAHPHSASLPGGNDDLLGNTPNAAGKGVGNASGIGGGQITGTGQTLASNAARGKSNSGAEGGLSGHGSQSAGPNAVTGGVGVTSTGGNLQALSNNPRTASEGMAGVPGAMSSAQALRGPVGAGRFGGQQGSGGGAEDRTVMSADSGGSQPGNGQIPAGSDQVGAVLPSVGEQHSGSGLASGSNAFTGGGTGWQTGSGARNPATTLGISTGDGGQETVQTRPGGRKTGTNPKLAGQIQTNGSSAGSEARIPGGLSTGQIPSADLQAGEAGTQPGTIGSVIRGGSTAGVAAKATGGGISGQGSRYTGLNTGIAGLGATGAGGNPQALPNDTGAVRGGTSAGGQLPGSRSVGPTGVPGAMSLAQAIRGSSSVGWSGGQQGSGGGTGNRAVISTDSGGDQAGAAQSGAGRQYSGGGLADENNPVAGGSSVSGGGFGVDMASGFEAGTEMTILPGKIHEGLALLSGGDSVEEFYEEPIDDEATKDDGWEDGDDPARSTEEDPVNGPGALEEREFASGEADFHHEAWEEDDAAGETEELAQKEANGNDLGEGGGNESLADIADTEFEDEEGTSAEYATDSGSFAEDGHTGSAPIVDEGDGVTDVAEGESGADTEVAGISGDEFGGNEDPADSEAKPPSKADSAGEDVAEAPGQESPEGEDAAKAGPEEDRPTGVPGKGEKRDMVQLVREHRRTLEQGGERPDLSGMSASERQAYIAELKNTIERERSLQRDLDTEITRLEGDRTGYVLQVGAVVTGTLAGLDSVSAVASGIAEAVGLKQGKAAGAARDFGRKLGNTINDFAGMLGIDMSEVLFGQFSGTGAASASGKAGEQATGGSVPSNGREVAGDGNANSAIANTGAALGAGRGGAEAALGLAEKVANMGIAYENAQNGKESASGITGWKVTKKIAQRASGDLALITNPVDAAKDVRSAYREFGKQGSVGNSGHVFRKTARATNTATQSITHQIKRMNEIMGIRDPLLNKKMDTLSSGGRMLEATSRLTNPDAGLSDRIGAGQTVLREGTKVIQGNVGKSPTTKKVLKKFTNEGTQRVVEGTAQVVGALESSVEGYRLGSRIIAQNQWSLKHHSKLRAASDTRLKVYREMLERTEQNQQGRRSSSQLR